ncbi:MAG: hypothetical protein AB8D52_07250 [Gammaproteobacteria bacterium]
MKKIIVPVILSSLFLIGCSDDAGTEKADADQAASEQAAGTKTEAVIKDNENVSKLWESSDSELKTPESVIHDQKRNVIYVSSMNSGPMEKEEKGFISKMSLEGEILELEWFSKPLWSPTGMAIAGDQLYVADVNRVVQIDLETATLVSTYPVSSAVFFNDVAADQDGNVYVSDMMTNSIHRIKDGFMKLWVTSEKLDTPNGLTVAGENLIVGSWGVIDGEGFSTSVPGRLLSVGLCDTEISDLGSASIGNLDGVEQMPSGNFLVTDWLNGKLLSVDQKGQAEMLLDLEQGSADHEYISESGLVLIPMMNNNKVVAYSYKE